MTNSSNTTLYVGDSCSKAHQATDPSRPALDNASLWMTEHRLEALFSLVRICEYNSSPHDRHPERACAIGLRVSEGSEVAHAIFRTCAALINRLHSGMHCAWIYIMTNSRDTACTFATRVAKRIKLQILRASALANASLWMTEHGLAAHSP